MVKLLFVSSILLVIVSVYMMVGYERRLSEKSALLTFDQVIIQDQQEQIDTLKERNRTLAKWLFGEILDGQIEVAETD